MYFRIKILVDKSIKIYLRDTYEKIVIKNAVEIFFFNDNTFEKIIISTQGI